jgi:carbon-monoxide dehydrogenase large subunit
VMNALTDALGVRDIEMPATPQRIWRVCRETKMKKAA